MRLNPKKSYWSPPDDQYGYLELFFDNVDMPSNLTSSEFSALNSLRARNDIVLKPADKGGALVVWKADLYREEAQRQLSHTTFYSRVDKDLTSTHQTTISNTIHNFIASGDLPEIRPSKHALQIFQNIRFNKTLNSSSLWMSNPYTLSFRIMMV